MIVAAQNKVIYKKKKKKVPNGALDINLKERRRENRRNTEAGRRTRMGGG